MALSAVLTSNCNFRLFVFGILVLLLLDLTQCITTIHHDKPTFIRLRPTNSTIAPSERQKRLLPYYNFYLDQPLRYNHRQPPNIYIDANNYRVKAPQQNHVLSRPSKIQFTPFLDSNALAGPFVPIHKQPQQNVYTPPYQTKVPTNYDELYKLAQLKLLPHPESYSHNYKPVQNYRKPAAVQFIPVEEYQVESRPVMQPIKTVIQTYKPTEIEITTTEEQNSNPPQTIVEDSKRVPELTNQDFAHPITSEEHRQYEEDRGNYVADKRPANLPQQKPYQPVIKYQPIYQYVSAHKYKPTQNFLITPPPPPPVPPSPTTTTTKPTTEIPPTIVITSEPENPHSLNLILKQLQDSNTLPQTLTPDNIDNSIKTLVKILNSLKKQPKFAKPIVVVDENVDYEEANEAEEVEPEVVTQNFPAITESGGTPGKAGIDYPALSTIPKTNFNCKTQRYKGFFGDPDTNCQVWHYCDLNGGQASFLCPNGTIFSQVALTCDWWFNVKCASTPQLYVLNERLYKYILPLSPKFPEDYSGPLVDKYLALKFQEMEDKMRKEKKGKVEGASEEEANSETNEEKISEEEQDYVTTAEAETAQ